jgi:uncharacterized SAM-binding protein YcdF (DUF218 family)
MLGLVGLVLFVTIFSQSRLESMITAYKTSPLKKKLAIIILGGGLKADGTVYPHTELRLAKAAELYVRFKNTLPEDATNVSVVTLIPLSGGTPHKPPPLDSRGFPIAEATAAVQVLLSQYSIPPADISEEPYSVDTLGNAYFLRTLHMDPGKYSELYVVTNEWHMARTKAMFQHVFDLPLETITTTTTTSSNRCSAMCPVRAPPKLHFIEVGSGLDPALLKVRRAREQVSLAAFEAGKHAYSDLEQLHTYMFTQHAAYATSRLTHARAPLDKDVLATY